MTQNSKIDFIDAKILGIIQEDASLSVQDLADHVGLSATPCWRRLKHLETTGVIERRVALLNAAAVGLGVTGFVFIRTSRHDSEWVECFARAVNEIPEIIECHRMSGSVDYLLKCVIADIDHYDRIYKALIKRVPDLADVSSGFSMERLKYGTKLPVSAQR